MEEHKIDRVEEERIDLLHTIQEFWKALRKLYIPLLALTVLCGAAYGVYRWRQYVPMYESSVTFTVRLTESSMTDISTSSGYYDRATAQQMSVVFPYLMQSSLMQSKLREAMGTDALGSQISAETVKNTNLFCLRVRNRNPQKAFDTLMALIEVYPEVAEYVIGQTGLSLLTEPRVAQTPYNSFSPVPTVLKGAAAGLAAGLALIFLYSLTRKTIRDPEDVKRYLNQKCLAVVPRVNLKKRDRSRAVSLTVRTRAVPGAFHEGIRSLRLKVMRELEKQNWKVLLVTSTMPGEGKSTIAVNLALSLSQNGSKVILVDLDLRKPVVRKILNVTGEALGPAELLDRHLTEPAEYLMQLDNTSLYLLASDTPSDNAGRILGSHRLQTLIEQLREEADYVILDTPPSGILADSVSISRAADAAIYVLGAELVEKTGAIDGLQYLGTSGIPVMGCVLNGARTSNRGYGDRNGYGYGHYGHYGSGYGHRKKSDSGDASEPQERSGQPHSAPSSDAEG